ncbi:MAG: serine hydrolase domain-containing protein, partial [Sphingobium limneticum]
MRSFMMMVLAMLAVIASPSAHAQSVPSATPADLELYFDGIIPYALEQAGIPGAAVSVVKDDRMVFAKGYGVADVKTGRRVTPGATLFRIGSISKLLTWTAVMQLAEQGKLDLDRDINTYLD